jgi:hypothetical protein
MSGLSRNPADYNMPSSFSVEILREYDYSMKKIKDYLRDNFLPEEWKFEVY